MISKARLGSEDDCPVYTQVSCSREATCEYFWVSGFGFLSFWVSGFKVSGFQVLRFLGFWVSWFYGFKVSGFLGFWVLRFLGFKVSGF